MTISTSILVYNHVMDHWKVK